jgi:hypothetical protein
MARKNKVEFSLETLLANTTSSKQLEGFIEELMLCKMKIKSEREAISDIIKECKDSLGVPGKILNGLVNEKMNPGSIDQQVHEIEEVQQIAEGLGI